MGDTLASELGILSSSPPILLTTLKTVPPGTNGALSFMGTAASVGGGMAMGWTMWAALSVENAVCRDQTGDLFLLLLGWGAIAGGLGSLVRTLFLLIIGTRAVLTLFRFGGNTARLAPWRHVATDAIFEHEQTHIDRHIDGIAGF
jgi:uncharacterized membrane protein